MSKFQFGTVGTPKSTPKNPGGAVGGVLRLAEMGLDAFEIGWVRSVRVKEETCARINQTAVEQGVSISVHAPYYINLNADEGEWPKSRKRLMDAAYYGFLAGATDIIFHPGSYFQRDPSEVLDIAIPRLKGCIEELRKNDIAVTLRPETMGKSAMLGSLEDTLHMAHEIEGVEPCIDFAHLHARTGDGSLNSHREWLEVLQTYEATLGKRSLNSIHAHLSGIEYGPKGEKNHLMLRESDFELQGLLQALADMNCSGRILIESPIMEEDALYVQKSWKKVTT